MTKIAASWLERVIPSLHPPPPDSDRDPGPEISAGLGMRPRLYVHFRELAVREGESKPSLIATAYPGKGSKSFSQ